MIQESVNQLLNTVALASRLSPGYERKKQEQLKRVEAEDALSRAKAAGVGLKDISENLAKKSKKYTETELADIESRVAEHNRNIYNARTMAIPGSPHSRYITEETLSSELQPQKKYTKMLSKIESNLEQRRMALERMRESGNASLEQNKEWASHKAKILENKEV